MRRNDAIFISRGAAGQSVSVSGTSARTSANVNAPEVLIYSTVECFAQAGDSTVTATVANGTPIPAGILIRVTGLQEADRIAFITTGGTGTVYVRPNT